MTTYGGVIFYYYRETRGRTSRALRAAGLSRNAEYMSSAEIRSAQSGGPIEDPKPTPRYVFHDATRAQLDRLNAALDEDGEGTEVYSDPEW